MRIDGDDRNAKCDVQDHIGGLAANAGKGFQRLAASRNLAVEILEKPLRQGDDIRALARKRPIVWIMAADFSSPRASIFSGLSAMAKSARVALLTPVSVA